MKLKIGPLDYQVRYRTAYEDPDSYGQCHKEDETITLRADVSAGRQLDTLIHEVLHACYDAYTRSGCLDEEAVCSFVGSALAAVIRDNPEFLAALTKGAKGRPVL